MWQPIADAPQDGRRLLAYFPFDNSVRVVRWDKNVYEPDLNWTLDGGESATLTFDPPTHCMPLPRGPHD